MSLCLYARESEAARRADCVLAHMPGRRPVCPCAPCRVRAAREAKAAERRARIARFKALLRRRTEGETDGRQ